MSTYQELRGLKVKYLAANPSPATAGDVWYDSATYQLKGFVGRAAWSSAAAVIVGRYNSGGAGTQTAAFVAGGAKTPDAVTDETYEYNGTGWSTGGTMAGDDRLTTACGTLTAGLAASGWDGTANTADSEEYDGTSWTAGNDVNTARRYGGQFGIQTAGVLVAGYTTTQVASTEEYNGTSWTAGENANTALNHVGAAGTLTAGLKCGGEPTSAATEEYDGTDWTSVNNMNTARRPSTSTFGIQTAAIAAGGYTTAAVANVEEYDGTTWTEIADLAAATYYGSGMGTNLAGVHTNGLPGYATATEEYNNTFDVVTQGAWAAGGNTNNSTHEGRAGAGSQTAAVVWGGYLPSPSSVTVDTEEYDGSSWTETANLPIGVWNSAGFGTQTAAVSAGGGWNEQGEAGIYRDETKEYDGSSWSNGNDMNENRTALSGTGTLTAGLGVAGYRPGATPAYLAFTEEYDGTNWTAGTALPGARGYGGAAGTQTAALYMGSYTAPPATRHDESFEYDGSSWTDGGVMLKGRSSFASMQQGTQTDALIAGGSDGVASQTSSEGYDGTTWSTRPSLASSIESAAGAGTATAGLTVGSSSAPRARTFEFTGETSAETGSTLDFD